MHPVWSRWRWLRTSAARCQASCAGPSCPLSTWPGRSASPSPTPPAPPPKRLPISTSRSRHSLTSSWPSGASSSRRKPHDLPDLFLWVGDGQGGASACALPQRQAHASAPGQHRSVQQGLAWARPPRLTPLARGPRWGRQDAAAFVCVAAGPACDGDVAVTPVWSACLPRAPACGAAGAVGVVARQWHAAAGARPITWCARDLVYVSGI